MYEFSQADRRRGGIASGEREGVKRHYAKPLKPC